MIQYLRICLSAFLLVFLIQFAASAQNCTINAGADRVICPGDPFVLTGSASSQTGTFVTNPVWTQIAGPAVTISSTTLAGGSAQATVTGASKGISYTFRLSSKCSDGTPIQDDAVYSLSPLTVANAGPDANACAGTYLFAANAVQAGEVGTWSVVSGPLSVPSPASTTVNSSANVATVNLPFNSKIGATIFRWTITSSSGSCISTDDVSITNLGGDPTVTATTPINVGCYTVTASQQLSASYGGDHNQPLQRGTWTFISGPSTPTFDDIHVNNTTIHNLIGGTYTIRWTVAGQCVNGFKDVIINVDSPSQDVTNAGNNTSTYCDGRTNTILNGVKPQYTNEIVTWTAAGGNPTVATFSSTTTPTTVIGNLDGHSDYNFTYTITNSVTHCTSTGNYRIHYATSPTITITASTPQVLACGAATYNIPYTVAGGTGTGWALISGPAGSTVEGAHGYNNYTTASDNLQTIVGLNLIGTYVIRFRRSTDNASGGCGDAFADISIVVSKTPYQASAGTPQNLVCHITTATLAGNAAQTGDSGTGQWTQVSGPNNAVFANTSLYNTGVSGLASGAYIFRWIVSGGFVQCGDTQSDVKVVVAATPTTVNAGTNVTGYCFGTPLKLGANTPNADEIGTWSVVSESPVTPASTIAFSNTHDPTAIVSGLLANKTYVFRWTISNACDAITSDVTVTTSNIAGPKQAVATSSPACLPFGTTSFTIAGNAATGTETGTWSLLTGAPNTPTFSTTAASQTVTGVTNGTYKFVWALSTGTCNPTLDTAIVTISPATTTASITGAPSQTVCGLGPLSIVGNTPAATELGTWTQTAGPGGAAITDIHSPSTTVTGLIEGRYTFTWTITNNSCSSSSANITYTLSAPPTTAAAGPDQSLCNVTTATLAANTITVGTGLWSVISGPNTPSFSSFTNPVATLSGLTLGTYILRWTSTNGPYCAASSDDVSIVIGQHANAGADQALCNTTTTVLAGNEGSTGTWIQVGTTPNVAVLTPNSNNTFIATGLTTGTYTFRYTITIGGCGTFTDDVDVVVSGPPSVADAGVDKELCTSAGTSVTLAGITPGSGTGLWSIISQPTGSVATLGTASSNTSTLDHLTKAGVYLLQWQVSLNNCMGPQSNNDIMRVTVYDPPTTAQAMADQPNACVSKVTLTATTPTIGVGTWTFIPVDAGDTRTPVFTAVNSSVTTVTGLVVDARPYTFRWTIVNGTCNPSSADVHVTVKDVTPSDAHINTPVQSVCTNGAGGTTSIALTADVPSVGTGTWTVISQPAGSGTVTFTADANTPTATAGNLKAGVYVLNWTVANLATACTTVAVDTLKVYDPPSTAVAGTPGTFCLFAPVTLGATAPAIGIGTWATTTKPGSAADPVFSSVNDPAATVTGLQLGGYVFSWTTSNGPCAISTATVAATITDCQIAVSKEASTPVLKSDKSFDITFKFHIKNTGAIAVNNVQTEDDMSLTFPSPKTYTITSIATAGTNLHVNSSFNGAGNNNLLIAATSNLAAGAEEVVTVVVNVKLN